MKRFLNIFIFVFLGIQAFGQPILKWEKSFGGSKNDIGYSLAKTKDGGYILAGATTSMNNNVAFNHDTSGNTSDFWIVRFDSTFAIQWERSFGGSRNDVGLYVTETFDGGYAVAGRTFSNDGDVLMNHDTSGAKSDILVLKLSSNGAILWQKCIGGSLDEEPNQIIEGIDSSLFIIGSTTSFNGDIPYNHDSTTQTQDALIVKLDTAGVILWTKVYGGSSFQGESAANIFQLPNGSFVLSAASSSSDGDLTNSGSHSSSDLWVLRLDSSGTILYDTCFGGNGYDFPTSLLHLTDTTYVISGVTNSKDGDVSGFSGFAGGAYDFWTAGISTVGDSAFKLTWNKCLGGPTTQEVPFSTAINPDNGNILIAGLNFGNSGMVTGNHGGSDVWCVELNSSHDVVWKNSFGGSLDDGAYSILSQSNSEYLIAGQSNSNNGNVSYNRGGSDVWIMSMQFVSSTISNSTSNHLFTLYPNPSNGRFNIQMNSDWESSSEIYVTVSDLTGRAVYAKAISAEGGRSIGFDLSSLSSGMYLVNLRSQSVSQTVKLVVE